MTTPSQHNADLAAQYVEDYLRESCLLDGRYKALSVFHEQFQALVSKWNNELEQYDSSPSPDA